jgi:hypothetical protein
VIRRFRRVFVGREGVNFTKAPLDLAKACAQLHGLRTE